MFGNFGTDERKIPNISVPPSGPKKQFIEETYGSLSEISTFLKACGLNSEFWDHIHQKTAERKDKRHEERLNQTQNISLPNNGKSSTRSGRPVQALTEDSVARRERFVTQVGQDIPIQKLKVFFACLIAMGIRRFKSCSSYFDISDEIQETRGCPFVSSRITHDQFSHILASFDFDIDWVENHLPLGI